MGGKQQAFREAITWLRSQGWTVDEERKGYPMAFCPCGAHHRSIHRTPGNPRYYAEMRQWVQRTCQREGGTP